MLLINNKSLLLHLVGLILTYLSEDSWKIRLYSFSVYFCEYSITQKACGYSDRDSTTSVLLSHPLLYEPVRMFQRRIVFTFVLTYDLVSPPAAKSLTAISLSLFFWRNNPQWVMASFTRFLERTRRRTTVGRTPLDE